MLASKEMPPQYASWNARHGAPFGRRLLGARAFRRMLPKQTYWRLRGPFSIQTNNVTRAYEYPWAFHAAAVSKGTRVLEVGGGLSGFQFALDREGCSVVNVDPGLDAKGVGWACDTATMRKLNGIFGTSIDLRNCTIDKANLEPEFYDRAFSISVLEHLPADEIVDVMQRVYKSLKPGGYFILTVDLFLNIFPFCTRERNEYGSNIDVASLIGRAPFTLINGNKQDLFGFPEFSTDRILSNLEQYFLGSYPVLAQCLVLQKQSR